MVVIYIQKSWLDTVGYVKDLLLIRDHPNDYISVLAGPTQVNFPFVEAKLARKENTEGGECFIPARIPVALVSGIFDLTEGETSNYGFHPSKRK